MRPSAEVRAATSDDLAGIASLCEQGRAESPSGAQVCDPDPNRVIRHLAVLLELPSGHILVAVQDGEVVGFVLARAVELALFENSPVVYVEALYVGESARRRGVGRQLIAKTAELAQSIGANEVYSVPIPGSRGVQRFLARLGFAPLAGHRVVSTAVLQRHLARDSRPQARRGRSLEDLIARRRRARDEGLSGPVDLRELRPDYQPPAVHPPVSDPVAH